MIPPKIHLENRQGYNQDVAASHIRRARKELDILKSYTGSLEQKERPIKLDDGTIILCKSVFGEDSIYIASPKYKIEVEETEPRLFIIRLTRPDGVAVNASTLSYISFYATGPELLEDNPFDNPVYLYDAINPDNVHIAGSAPLFSGTDILIDSSTFTDGGVGAYWVFYNCKEATTSYQDGVRIQYPSKYKALDLWQEADRIEPSGVYEDVVPYGRFHLRVTGQHSGRVFNNDDYENICLYFEMYTPSRDMIMFEKTFREDLTCWDLTLPGTNERPTQNYPQFMAFYTVGAPIYPVLNEDGSVVTYWLAYNTHHHYRQYHRMATQYPLRYLWDDLWEEADRVEPGTAIIDAKIAEYCELIRTEGGDDDEDNRYTFSCFDENGLDDGLFGAVAGKYEYWRTIPSVPTADQRHTYRVEYITGNALCLTSPVERETEPRICNNFCTGEGYGTYDDGLRQPSCPIFDPDYMPIPIVPGTTGDTPVCIATLGGVGPMTWTITGQEGQSGFSLEYTMTNADTLIYEGPGHGQERNWIHTDNACGAAKLTVTDACGGSVETIFRTNVGHWHKYCDSGAWPGADMTCCQIPGSGDYLGYYNLVYNYELIEDDLKQEQLTYRKIYCCDTAPCNCAEGGCAGAPGWACCHLPMCAECSGIGPNCIGSISLPWPCRDKPCSAWPPPGEGVECYIIKYLFMYDWVC